MSHRSHLLRLAAGALAATTVLGGLGASEASAATHARSNTAVCDPSVCPAGFSLAANEGGQFTIVGTADVAYGAKGQYTVVYGMTGTVQCNNTTFGDPAPYVSKYCSTRTHTGTTLSLLQNGNADNGSATTNASDVVPALQWDATGNATAVRYGSVGFLSKTDPGPKVRGANFFAGGPSSEASEESQQVSLEPFRKQIVNGHVTFTLSGYFGGWLDQRDQAGAVIEFHDALGNVVRKSKIGFVTAAQRHNVTELLRRSITASVPARASDVDVHLEFFRYDGSYNDGYADSISLKLSGI